MIKVKQAKDGKKGKGRHQGTDLHLDAANGSILKASFKGDGLDTGAVTVLGPSGPVPFEAKLKGSKLTILPTVLDAGTGRYTIRFASSVSADFKWSLKPPKAGWST